MYRKREYIQLNSIIVILIKKVKLLIILFNKSNFELRNKLNINHSCIICPISSFASTLFNSLTCCHIFYKDNCRLDGIFIPGIFIIVSIHRHSRWSTSVPAIFYRRMFILELSSSDITCFILSIGIFFNNFLIGKFNERVPDKADEYYFDLTILSILRGVREGSSS